MRSKLVLLVFLPLLVCPFLSNRDSRAAAKTELIGTTTIGWYLTSTEDRMTNPSVSEVRAAQDKIYALEAKEEISQVQEVKKRKPAKKEMRPREIRWDGRFIAYDNGTVRDTWTGLMWAAKDNGSDIKWAAARSYCKHYRGGGYKDWRMPTEDELAELYDAAKTYKSDCGSDFHVTDLIHLTCYPWSSKTNDYGERAFFGFDTGVEYWMHPTSKLTLRALPVRSGT